MSDQYNTDFREMTRLSEEDKAYAEEFAKTIDLSAVTAVVQYGAVPQKRVTDFPVSSLYSTSDRELKEICEIMETLVKALNTFRTDYDSSDEIRRNDDSSAEMFRSLYEKAERKADEAARRLEISRSSLIRDMKTLEGLYQKGMNIIKEFDLYILAGKICLDTSAAELLKEKNEKAERTGLLEDSLSAKDYQDACSRFEKKLSDLSVSRQIPLQICMQIRLQQNNDSMMADSLRTLTANAFPLWKNRICLSAGVNPQGQPGLITAEQFHEANDALISTLNNMIALRETGLNKRRNALDSLF